MHFFQKLWSSVYNLIVSKSKCSLGTYHGIWSKYQVCLPKTYSTMKIILLFYWQEKPSLKVCWLTVMRPRTFSGRLFLCYWTKRKEKKTAQEIMVTAELNSCSIIFKCQVSICQCISTILYEKPGKMLYNFKKKLS